MALLQLPSTVEELRAIVGADGADLSDAALLDWDARLRGVGEIVVRRFLDELNPDAARRREASEKALRARELASRRRRYPRERAQKARKRAAAAQGNR